MVETSHAMQRRAEAMAQAVRGLLESALASQARSGDTLGVWTYNEGVHAGQLPLQQWSPNNRKALQDRVVDFLKAQKLEKSGRLDQLMPALDRVIRGSQFITIILVCFGDQEIHGTPFDPRINEFFRTWHAKQPDAGAPFVIALRGQAGKFADCTMNPFPWPAELPALPEELLVPAPAPVPVAVEPRKPPSPVPPLIITGKKRETATSTKSADTAAETNLAAAATGTNPAALPQLEPKQLEPQPTFEKPAVNRPAQVDPEPAGSQTSAGSAAVAAQQQAPLVPTKSQSTASPLVPPPVSPQTAAATAPIDFAPAATGTTSRTPSSTPRLEAKTPPVEVASAAAPRRSASPLLLAGIGLAALTAAVAAVWMWQRRLRPSREASLITESFDRRKR